MQFIKEKAAHICAVAALVVSSSLLSLVGPMHMQKIMDAVVSGSYNDIIFYLATMIVFGLLSLIVGMACSFLVAKLGLLLGERIKEVSFNHIIAKYRPEYSAGDLSSRVMNDCGQISQFFSSIFPSIVLNVVTIVIYFAAAFCYDLYLASFSMVIFPLLIIASSYYSKKTQALSREERKESGKLMNFVQSSFAFPTALLGAGLKKTIAGKHSVNLRKYTQQSYDLTKNRIVSSSAMSLIGLLQQVAFFATIILSIASGRITIGEFLTINALCSKIFSLAQFFSNLPIQWAQVSASVIRVEELLCDDVQVWDSDDDEEHLLEVSNASLPTEKFVTFSGISGSILGLRGNTGSGKTTLALRIAGILPAETGIIRRSASSDEIAYVPASGGVYPMLSLRENLGGQANTKIDELLPLLDMKTRWEATGLDYDSSLENIAVQLSTGEIQRIAIGRLLGMSAKIIILDEAVTNIEPDSASSILKHIASHFSDAFILIISHRESDFKVCDQIIDLSGL